MAIDIEAIKAQYTQGNFPTIRTFYDGSGREVIGDAVDEETNKLYYVIRDTQGNITVEPAENQPVVANRLKGGPFPVKIETT